MTDSEFYNAFLDFECFFLDALLLAKESKPITSANLMFLEEQLKNKPSGTYKEIEGLIKKNSDIHKNIERHLSNTKKYWEIFKPILLLRMESMTGLDKEYYYNDLKGNLYYSISLYIKYYHENIESATINVYKTLSEFCDEVKKGIELLNPNNQFSIPKAPKGKIGALPMTFKELFMVPVWKKYVDCLDPYVIIRDGKYYFNGKPKKDKCIVASWFRVLQNKGKTQQINRQQLSIILNAEIVNLMLGKDGKTFDTPLPVYAEEVIEKLKKKVLI